MIWPQNWFASLVFFFFAAASAATAGTVDDDHVVFLQSFADVRDDSKSMAWRAPDYSGQEKRLGYDAKAFQTTPELKDRIDFWKDIYAKYDSDKGLLHDARFINLVYEVIELPTRETTGLEKEALLKVRRKSVEEAKKRTVQMLKKLQAMYDAKKDGSLLLQGKELEVWNTFKSEYGRKKFLLASKKNRLRMQLGQKDHFVNAIYYSGRYLREIEKVFAEYNLPKELTRLPFVESSFNILAESKVGASGIWQFMRYTGRQYLRMNRYVDDRNDPLRATRAAAKMFKWIYGRTEAWPLAITGYNYGPSGIRRLAKKYKTKSLAELIQKVRYARFGFASQNFYASFIAALEVEKEADKYFENPRISKELPTEKIQLERGIMWKHLVGFFNGDEVLARVYNPRFTSLVRRGYFAIPKKYEIALPEDRKAAVLAQLKKLPQLPKKTFYKVRRGETLTHIARRFDVPVHRLQRANGITRPNRLRIGQLLKIPN